MKCFFDSNVIIDALTNREGTVDAERHLLYSAALGQINGIMCAKQMTDIYYALRKYVAEDHVRRELLSVIMEAFGILRTDKTLLSLGLYSKMSDFEDAVIVESAKMAGATLIITNDVKGFRDSGIDVKTPTEALAFLGIHP